MESLSPTPVKWSISRKFFTIFFAFYFGMQLIDMIISFELLPFVSFIFTPYVNAWESFIKWAGKNVFRLSNPITVLPNGSGDTTYNFVQLFLWVVVGLVVATIWVLVDYKHTSFRRLEYWMRILIRYYVGYTMLIYGSLKVIKLQFPFPDLSRLTQPYGDSSPMGLAWTFIGYSSGYNIFIGGAEVLAGALLFFKRTTLLGALISIVVMTNVAAMNFSYDIPVKIFSVNLVVLSVYLACFDLPRLINLFLLNRPADAAQLAMPGPKKWKMYLQYGIKTLVIAYMLYGSLWNAVQTRHEYGDLAPKPPLYGIYNVADFLKNRDTILPLTTDTARWKQIIITSKNYATVKTMTDSVRRMRLGIDTVLKVATFKDFRDTTLVYSFQYQVPQTGKLMFTGKFGADSLIISTNRFDENNFRLVNRGYHWINEYPYNR
jgi:hypothetical protein